MAALFTVVFLTFISICIGQKEQFNEELFIKPLPNGYIYNYFQFTTIIAEKLESKRHYRLFPKTLGEVLNKYSVQELHLTLTQSFWRHETWGYPFEDSAPGAELWIWFKERTPDIDESWTELINVLSGMFCASLNFMDSTNTIIPKIAFKPQGTTNYAFDRFATNNIRYAALPREIVCTENLTPWKKLLPCGSRAGLGSVFNALKLHDSSYHSLGIHIRPVCQDADCEHTGVELKQTLSVVFDTTHINPTPVQDWNFKRLFGRMVTTSCPLAEVSSVYVDTSKKDDMAFKLTPEPTRFVEVKRGTVKSTYALYEISDFVQNGHALNINSKYANSRVVYQDAGSPILTGQRFQSGYGQEKGGIVTLIYNNHPKKDITVSLLETIPWFLRVYLHTLKIESFPAETENFTVGTDLKREHLTFKPGADRRTPYHIELVFTLPHKSVTRVSFEFERALLKWTEYPPDANHGFYVNSAVISTIVPTSKHYTAIQQNASLIRDIFDDESTQFFLRIHTETVLVSLPTPDFSMPYNVICLACTVVAIAFGSIHNLTTRRFRPFDAVKDKGLVKKLKEKFKSCFGSTKDKEVKIKQSTECSSEQQTVGVHTNQAEA